MEAGTGGATPKQNEFYQNYISNKNKLLQGKSWFINETLYVKDSPSGIATLQVEEKFVDQVAITKNGTVVTEDLIDVLEKDQISIEVRNETVLPKCTVRTDEQQLKAFIEVEPGYKITRKIKNTFPSRRSVISLEEKKTITEKVSIESIRLALREAEILFGIKEEVILVAAQADEKLVYEVASGIPPQNGKDGYLEMKADSKIKRQLKKDDRDAIDFRETREIPVVEPGTVIGIIHPPTTGDIGRSVTNKPIQPSPVLSLTFYPDKGVVLDNHQIIATKSGRPHIYQANHIVKAAVIPKFIQAGNVNLASGNLRFFGDVEVQGEIEENMIIDAGNDVVIQSSINRSTVTAGNSIESGGNVANSILSVGEKNEVILQLGYYLTNITAQLEEIQEMMTQITQSEAYEKSDPKQSLRSIFKFLLRHRFSTFVSATKDYMNLVHQEKDFLTPEWQDVAEQLKFLLFTIAQTDITFTQIQVLLSLMKDIQDMSLLDFEENRLISIVSAANSTISCNGMVQITGKGCLNCIIKAQGKVEIAGYLRGGQVIAKLGIHVHTVGTSSGIKTDLSVPGDQMIHIEKAYEGTVLNVGRQRMVLTETYMNLQAHLNEAGELVLQ